MAAVARVTARLGDELLEITQVTSRYTIGTEPGCDFAAEAIGMFALVTRDEQGFVVRCPIGLELAIDGVRSHELETRLIAGTRITVRLSMATLEIILAEPARATLPFTGLDLRALPFIAVSLVAHLSLWAVAITSVHHKLTRPIPRVVTHPVLAHLPPLPPPAPAPQPEPSPPVTRTAAVEPAATATSAAAPGHGRRAARRAEGVAFTGVDMGASFAALAAASANLQSDMAASKLYNPEMEHGREFGGGTRMNPDQRAGWGNIAIKTGDHYKTMSYDGEAPNANDLATTQQLALCDSRLCEATGGLDTETVKQIVVRHMVPIATCLGRKGPSFIVDLEIATTGAFTITGANSYTHCVSDALAHEVFPKAGEATHVAFTVGWPST